MTRSGPRWFAAGMVGVLVMGLLLLVLATPALAHEGGSTRGAPTNQVVVATAVAALLVAMVAVLARRCGHRGEPARGDVRLLLGRVPAHRPRTRQRPLRDPGPLVHHRRPGGDG